jgi:hypothetical protein
MTAERLWPVSIRLSDVDRKEQRLKLAADADIRKAIAKLLDLADLDWFEGSVLATSWLDGAVLKGAWSAGLTQTCVITLESLPLELSGRFELRVVPAGSPNAPVEDPDAFVDPEADDPPDVLEGQDIPVGDYMIEHLGLELDPFPRKPGAVFQPPEEPMIITPFAALKNFKPKGQVE